MSIMLVFVRAPPCGFAGLAGDDCQEVHYLMNDQALSLYHCVKVCFITFSEVTAHLQHRLSVTFDQLQCRETMSQPNARETQALKAAQAHMLEVSEQVSVAELATELAEARACFLERAAGNAPFPIKHLRG